MIQLSVANVYQFTGLDRLTRLFPSRRSTVFIRVFKIIFRIIIISNAWSVIWYNDYCDGSV